MVKTSWADFTASSTSLCRGGDTGRWPEQEMLHRHSEEEEKGLRMGERKSENVDADEAEGKMIILSLK